MAIDVFITVLLSASAFTCFALGLWILGDVVKERKCVKFR